jgi:hypothetical protein
MRRSSKSTSAPGSRFSNHKENTAIRNARRPELVSLLRQLANYVSATANGNLETLISSGFPIQKTTRTPIGPLPAPTHRACLRHP